MLVRVVLMLPLIELSLRLRGLRWTQQQLRRLMPRRPIDDRLTPDDINRIVRLGAGGGLYRATCLRRSLVLWWLLSRRGVQSEIKIGAHTLPQQFKAHAWVEWEGNGRSDAPATLRHYAVFKPWMGNTPE